MNCYISENSTLGANKSFINKSMAKTDSMIIMVQDFLK